MPTTRVPFGRRTLLSTTPEPVATGSGGFDLAAAMDAHPFAPADQTTHPPGTIGVVTGELLRYAAFWRSLTGLASPPGTALVQSAGMDIATNRNRAAASMRGDWLFTLDDDLVLLPDTLTRLLAVLAQGVYDVVCAYSLRRQPPHDSLVYLADPTVPPHPEPWIPDGRTGVMEIAAAGLGGVLISRRVFERLERPYFRVGQVAPDHLHEDVEFCRRVRAAGFRIAVDLDAPVGHITPTVVWPARTPAGGHHLALVGLDGRIAPVDPGPLRAAQPHPSLVGL